MDLIKRKIQQLQDVGVTAGYMAELFQLIAQDKSDALTNYKGKVLENLDIDINRPPIGSVSHEKIIKALNAAELKGQE